MASPLEDRSHRIIRNLVAYIRTPRGRPSSWTLSIYDTAWLSMISKVAGASRFWLFPECFQEIIKQQCSNGEFGAHISEIDKILGTIGALLAMYEHGRTPMNNSYCSSTDLIEKIQKAVVYLEGKLEFSDVLLTEDPGLGILITSLLGILRDKGQEVDFAHIYTLAETSHNLMDQMPLKSLNPTSSTALVRYLQALVEKLDFGKISHHIQNGAMLASPSSTAAYLIFSSKWDDQAEAYLRDFVNTGHRPVPSVFPTRIFDVSWALFTLLDSGFVVETLGEEEVSGLAEILEGELEKQSGFVGISPMATDNAAKAIGALTLFGRQISCNKVLETFEGSSHFTTCADESIKSLSAHSYLLIALALSPTPSIYASQLLQSLQLLCQAALRAALELWEIIQVSELDSSPVLNSIPLITLQICIRSLSLQSPKGTWGDSVEISAYALLTLKSLAPLPWILDALGDKMTESINLGMEYLETHQGHLIISEMARTEETSDSQLICEAYCLAALQAPVRQISDPKFRSLVDLSSERLEVFSKFFSGIPVLSGEPYWRLRASVAEGHMFSSSLLKSSAAAVFPQEKTDVGHKYLHYIPLTWTMCNNATGFGISVNVMREMMAVSMLNFQVDRYLERLTANEALRGKFTALRKVARTMCSHSVEKEPYGSKPDSSGSPGDNCDNNGVEDLASQTMGTYQNLLHDFCNTIHRFTSYVLNHTAVVRSPGLVRANVCAELSIFLQAHLNQGESNIEIQSNSEASQRGVPLPFASGSFYRWLHTVSADHTSCPYSFEFFRCLISPAGEDCFAGHLRSYIARDVCNHLASMCRMDNDYGSVKRDRLEKNLNSIDFPEFRQENERDEENPEYDTSGLFKPNDKILRERLMSVSQYERECLGAALKRLKPEIAPACWQALQVFVKVTDLYGQIYVTKDINDD
ncbi:Ent-kaurene synthase [Xylaria sp. FL1042]|nr:Ent-kaurene synthase [Xylaria sp. FL1042]